ncbi:hypothetical protein AltI4_44940 (plasmid) [Alteromonas sp. I4]|nr:hypothetical protein AltI4_44940 [Alteromonas sp. I4]
MQTARPDGFPPWTWEYWPQNQLSEDCLYLNIWVPESAKDKKLPVFVYIHGGGFTSGSGEVPLYDGEALARRDIIVVTINYRVGVFGFLAHPELTQEAGEHPPSNFGLQDQIAALQWIKANIHAFGGDPNHVTIGGQSAGSYSVHYLLTSPLAKGLFQGAIAASGVPVAGTTPSLATAEKNGLAYAEALGANSLSALRNIPASDFIKPPKPITNIRLQFIPNIDGKILPDDPRLLVKNGNVNDVPVLLGKTYDEGSALTPGWGVRSEQEYKSLLDRSFGSQSDRFATLYPAIDEESRSNSSKQLLNDLGIMTLYEWSRDWTQMALSPTYMYNFVHAIPGPSQSRWAAFHSSDLTYFLDNLLVAANRDFTAEDRILAQNAADTWANFIKFANPNGSNGRSWPSFDIKNPQLQQFGDGSPVVPFLSDEKKAAFEQYQASGGKTAVF